MRFTEDLPRRKLFWKQMRTPTIEPITMVRAREKKDSHPKAER